MVNVQCSMNKMKVLVATEKPFAAAAVNGIKAEIEAAGNELVLLEKYTEKAQFLAAVADADARSSVRIRSTQRSSTPPSS